MPTKKLTEVSIRALPLPEKGQVTYWDETVKNFGVRVSQGGSKSFVVLRGLNRHRTTLGRFGVIPLADARQRAKELLAEHTLGVTILSPISFDDAKAEYLELCERKNRPKTVYDYKRILERHFKFGKTQLAKITTRDIMQRVNRLSNTPRQQHYTFTVIKAFFRWAVRNRYIEISPLHDLTVPNVAKSRDRTLSGRELREVYTKAQAEVSMFGCIVQLLVLTGQRRNEIAGLRWEWIEGDTITFPAAFTKNERLHRLPLSKTALRILEDRPRVSEWVFPAEKRIVRGKETTFFNNWSKPKKVFDESLKNVAPYTLHDLRRTFSTKLAELGTPIHVTEKLLNHASGSVSGVAAVYNRYSYVDEMRHAVDSLADFLIAQPHN